MGIGIRGIMGILGGGEGVEIDFIDRMGIIDMGIIGLLCIIGLLYIICGEDGMCIMGMTGI